MRHRKLTYSIITLLVMSVGCAKSGTIQPAKTSESGFAGAVYGGETSQVTPPTAGEESFRIFHQAATGFVSVQTIRESAEKRATEFCIRKNKSLNVLEETVSTPPHILGNWPRIELVFECLVTK